MWVGPKDYYWALLILLKQILFINANFVYEPNPDIFLTMEQLVKKNGYPFEEHSNLVTPDGYILTMQRIPFGRKSFTNSTTGKPVVFLMHGVICTAETFTLGGPERGLAYILADLGYDVWLGNSRGTEFSRKHVNLTSSIHSKYWDYSFHEIGMYDLPTMIDYILNVTKAEKISYIGHSQGTSAFFVMASELPKYNEKINIMIALAPVAYLSHIKGPIYKFILQFYNIIEHVLVSTKFYELVPFRKILWESGKVFCSEKKVFESICAKAFFIFTGFDWQELNRPLVSLLFSRVPDDLSLRQVLHYAQIILSGEFKKFNYGNEDTNWAIYKTPNPPNYDLEKITTPIVLYYGANDFIVAEEDVEILSKKLPNVVEKYLIPYKKFHHMDFFLAKNVKKLIYNKILTTLNKYSKHLLI